MRPFGLRLTLANTTRLYESLLAHSEQNIFFVLKYYSYNIKPELDEVFDKILHSRVHTVFKRLFSGNKKITYNSDWIEDYDSLVNELEKIQRLYE